jgi:hypothetical protein
MDDIVGTLCRETGHENEKWNKLTPIISLMNFVVGGGELLFVFSGVIYLLRYLIDWLVIWLAY